VNWQSLEAHPVVDAGPDIVSAKERALPDVYASALASPGFAKLGPLLDDEAHFASPGMDDVHGPGAIVHAHDVLLGAFDDRKVTTGRVWRTPNEQTIEWTMTGTQARDWMGVAATQKPVTFRALTLLWTKDDGSITDVHVYVNVAVVKAQLGVGPKDLLSLPSPPPLPTGPAQVFETQTPSADEQRNVAAVKASLDALENNKESEYLAASTDDVEVSALERAQPGSGKEALRAYYKAMHKAIGQLDTTVDNAWGVASFAVVEYSIDGEQLGPIGWVPAQRDKVIRMELVDICEMSGGKIARVWRFDNPT
jgi:ketosteroid isomerase-like protein